MPQFMKMTLSTFMVPCLATSFSGAACSTSTDFFSSTKMGLSAIFIRMIQAPMVTNRLGQHPGRGAEHGPDGGADHHERGQPSSFAQRRGLGEQGGPAGLFGTRAEA